VTKVKIECHECKGAGVICNVCSDREEDRFEHTCGPDWETQCPDCHGAGKIIVPGELVQCCQYGRCTAGLAPGCAFFCAAHHAEYQKWTQTTKAEPSGDRTVYQFLSEMEEGMK